MDLGTPGWSRSHDQDGRHAHIWQKPFKNLLLRNRWADLHETWYVASGPWPSINCVNGDPGMTLTYFRPRSNLVAKAFVCEKVKMHNNLLRVQNTLPKPYIFLFLMIRHIKWHHSWDPRGSPGGMPHPLHFIKCITSWKPFRSPPINHIYSCSLR